jgi:hypothetical protein
MVEDIAVVAGRAEIIEFVRTEPSSMKDVVEFSTTGLVVRAVVSSLEDSWLLNWRMSWYRGKFKPQPTRCVIRIFAGLPYLIRIS